MHTNLRRGLLGTLFAGGLLALGTSVACAADTTSGGDGLASGTQVIAPITAPVTLGATSIGLLDDSTASTEGTTGGTAAPAPADTDGATTSGSDGLASGTQVTAPITAPVTLGATSIGLLGDSTASTGLPAEPGTDEPVTSPNEDVGDDAGAGASTDDSGAVIGTQGTVRTVGFASAGMAAQPKAPASGMLAMTGASDGILPLALILLCAGGLLLTLRPVLRRRNP